jgi:hypothetical protein
MSMLAGVLRARLPRLAPRAALVTATRAARVRQERTVAALTEARQAKGLAVSPQYKQNILQIFEFFPFTPEVVERVLGAHPEVLLQPSERTLDMVSAVVELGDFTAITQEEALLFVARAPELLQLDREQVLAQMSAVMSLTAPFRVSWNTVLIASPESVLLDPSHISKRLIQLQHYFPADQVRDVVGNNPTVFLMEWKDIRQKMDFLQHTMHVSARRVALTPASLTTALETYRARYSFLLRSGHYRHPDPGAKARVGRGGLLHDGSAWCLESASWLKC